MKTPFENIEDWFNTPKSRETEIFVHGGVKQIFYESVPYKGKTTEVFACYGLPEGASAEKPVPAVVLVHGGGATALADWVELWNRRGFAAISMDTCGCVPSWSANPYFNRNWPSHEKGGPRGWGKFPLAGDAPEDQWMYHAAAAVIIGHSFLRSLPEVDSDRIGVTGISWGGVLTCISAGLDDRFAYAMPVYGCGFLDNPDCSLSREGEPTAEQLAKWIELWDPSHYLPNIKVPTYFLVGSNDKPFPLDSLSRSVELVADVRQQIIVDYPHNHTISWEEETLYAFARAASDGTAESLPRFAPIAADKERLTAAFESGAVPVKAEIAYTWGSGFWNGRKWFTAEAEISSNTLSASIPPYVTAAYFTVTLPDGTKYSSRVADFSSK